MKTRNAAALMFTLSAIVAGVCLHRALPGHAFALMLLSIPPIFSMTSSFQAWKPWFMEGVEDAEEPSATIFVVQAVAFDALTVVGIFSGTALGWLLALRFLGAIAQFFTIGKRIKDTQINHENSTKPDPRPGPRNSRKS